MPFARAAVRRDRWTDAVRVGGKGPNRGDLHRAQRRRDDLAGGQARLRRARRESADGARASIAGREQRRGDPSSKGQPLVYLGAGLHGSAQLDALQSFADPEVPKKWLREHRPDLYNAVFQHEEGGAQDAVNLGRRFGSRGIGDAIVKYLDQHKEVNVLFGAAAAGTATDAKRSNPIATSTWATLFSTTATS